MINKILCKIFGKKERKKFGHLEAINRINNGEKITHPALGKNRYYQAFISYKFTNEDPEICIMKNDKHVRQVYMMPVSNEYEIYED